MLYRRHLEDLRLISLLCDRNPQVLLSREDAFRPSDLEHATVLLPAAATSQWMFLEGVLREAAIDLTAIRFIRDLELSTMMRLWRGGFGDFFLTNQPVAEALLDDGYKVAVTMAQLGGRVPWSVYYARRTYLQSSRSLIVAFVRALSRAHRWMRDQAGPDVAELIAMDFPEIAAKGLNAAIRRMMDSEVWPVGVRIEEEPLARYQRIIARYGLVSQPLPYADLVLTDIVSQVETELGV
jgi:NitT/TauT family transport system substrate-binding protein